MHLKSNAAPRVEIWDNVPITLIHLALYFDRMRISSNFDLNTGLFAHFNFFSFQTPNVLKLIRMGKRECDLS